MARTQECEHEYIPSWPPEAESSLPKWCRWAYHTLKRFCKCKWIESNKTEDSQCKKRRDCASASPTLNDYSGWSQQGDKIKGDSHWDSFEENQTNIRSYTRTDTYFWIISISVLPGNMGFRVNISVKMQPTDLSKKWIESARRKQAFDELRRK